MIQLLIPKIIQIIDKWLNTWKQNNSYETLIQ